jgi:phage shock protein PspC (stress-responsive transcriptional regulator)
MDLSSYVTTSINLGLIALVIWAIHRSDPRHEAPLYMQVRGRWLSGICAGIARALGLDVWIVRAGFGVGFMFDAHVIIAYLMLEVALRWDPEQRSLLRSNRLWARLRAAVAR